MTLTRAVSVRFKLLFMALLPMVVLMPLLLFIGMTRWTSDYDAILIENVQSDLRVAEQYLSRIKDSTGKQVEAIAGSIAFEKAQSENWLLIYLSDQKTELGLDFLYFKPLEALDKDQLFWPVIQSAAQGKAATEIDLFDASYLGAIDPRLASKAQIALIKTEAAVPTDRIMENRGMVIHTAAPIEGGGVLVGGILLNRNLDFIDTINSLVYLNPKTGGERKGTATLFLEDVRVSTNVRLFEEVRALGTRVSAEVRTAVLGEGRTWLDRAFVVNDWYISGYLPLMDSFDTPVGMLYVGFLEAPFADVKTNAILKMILIFACVSLVFIPLFLWLAGGVFAPLEKMGHTMRRIEEGDLSARNGGEKGGDEIRSLSAHFDTLLDQVQERDRSLRDWALELNTRVEQRTTELREANEKLETTYQQLMMSEKLASIGEITAGVAHEINNPVAVIQGNVDVIRMSLGDKAEGVKTELTLIDQQIMRISAIVGKLLQFARPADYGAYEENVDMAQLTSDCLVLVEHAYEKDQMQMMLKTNPVAGVKINPSELQQVIINLVINAIQAMSGTGKLMIEVHLEKDAGKDGVALWVSDTGPGLTPQTLENIFDPFFTTKQAEGTGLGLSISQTIIKRAGGQITARNDPSGQGAQFRVWLPLSRA